MQTLEYLLRQSMTRYGEIHLFLNSMEGRLAVLEPVALQSVILRLRSLQDDAATQDVELNRRLDHEGASAANLPLFQERLALLRRVGERNRLLLDKINGIISLISSELAQIRDGRTALNGYKTEQGHAGRMVRKAC